MISKEEYMSFIKEMLKEEKIKDEERLRRREVNKNGSVLLAISLFLIVVIPAFIINVLFGVVAFFIWLCIVFFVKPGAKSYAYYKKEYRNRALEFLLKDKEYTFDENYRFEESIIKESQMIGEFDKFESSDMLSINIPNDDNSKSNCYLTLCDLKATREEERVVNNDLLRDEEYFPIKRTETYTVDVYNGVFGYVEFPFEFKCLLCLNSDYKKKGVVLKDVKLEDIVFSRKFRVWCDDQIEARYILTPEMMEKLLYLKEKLKGIKVTLVDNKMYIASYGTDLFELRGKKENPESLFEKIYDDVNTILLLINEIKNNNKIFKM